MAIDNARVYMAESSTGTAVRLILYIFMNFLKFGNYKLIDIFNESLSVDLDKNSM